MITTTDSSVAQALGALRLAEVSRGWRRPCARARRAVDRRLAALAAAPAREPVDLAAKLDRAWEFYGDDNPVIAAGLAECIHDLFEGRPVAESLACWAVLAEPGPYADLLFGAAGDAAALEESAA